MKTINLCFWSTTLSFFKLSTNLGLFFLGHLGLIFGPVGHIFGVRVSFKNIFRTCECNYQNLVLDVQPSLFDCNLAKFEAFFAFFGPGMSRKLGPNWGLGISPILGLFWPKVGLGVENFQKLWSRLGFFFR